MREGEIIQFQLWNHVMKALQHPTSGIVPKNQSRMADAISNSKKKSTIRHCQTRCCTCLSGAYQAQYLIKSIKNKKKKQKTKTTSQNLNNTIP